MNQNQKIMYRSEDLELFYFLYKTEVMHLSTNRFVGKVKDESSELEKYKNT